MLSLDSTLRFIRKRVSFYLLLSPVFSLTGVLDSCLTYQSPLFFSSYVSFDFLCYAYVIALYSGNVNPVC